MGIEHVYDSRSTEFADLIRRDTDGYGVDIVLNSLTGAAQRAGLELLAIGGRFVEIGKRDIYANTRLGLYPFRRNLAFYYVDLALMCDSHPTADPGPAAYGVPAVADGKLPVLEHTALPACRGGHRDPSDERGGAHRQTRALRAAEGHSSVVVPPERARVFRRDGAYIITGGLGGLGLFLAAGMAAAGCGRIVLTGRSQPSPARSRPSRVSVRPEPTSEVECGNIAEPATAARLVAAATATGLPVRGVLHAAAVVEDATLTNITDELIDRDWAPKVYGAWHLHKRRPRSHWTGSAPSPRRPPYWARRARAPTPRPTVGWMASLTGAAPRAFPPRRSRGERGPRSGAVLSWQKAARPR